jgi:hypothetical protein
MPSYRHNPNGVPAGLPERLFQPETREYVRAAFAVEGFGPRDPGSAEVWPKLEIWQCLIAKSPCGHTTPVLDSVKGRYRGPGRSQGVLAGRAASGVNS